ncbi:hypothetical protein ASG67_00125 [Sphingomonas sp. Leaf339]|uniref:hypothetical protein n=1 Tax=Sphingomonas sp. Leaf339 TaxID=1736343 RepID=UPI0006F531B4|nr:hypothetical protein [Sphingomonas sp. Leaf339]KQU61643.1 hypothetical protein ASG67_00125 [Sphingomonas sp. Leaf339]
MTDIIVALSKQQNENVLETTVESENSIEGVLRRFDAKMVSSDQESGGTAYYRIADVAPDRVDQLLGELRNIAGLEAAYVKPADELP